MGASPRTMEELRDKSSFIEKARSMTQLQCPGKSYSTGCVPAVWRDYVDLLRGEKGAGVQVKDQNGMESI